MGDTYNDKLAELLAIDQQLAEVAADDFAARFTLKARRADLKHELTAMAGSSDDQRSVAELRAELGRVKAQRDQALRGQLKNNVAGTGTASLGAAIMGGWSEDNVNSKIDQASGRVALEARMKELERQIAQRISTLDHRDN